MPQDRKKAEKEGGREQDRDRDLDAELDRALMDSFPASDPISLSSPTKTGRANGEKDKAAKRAPPRK